MLLFGFFSCAVSGSGVLSLYYEFYVGGIIARFEWLRMGVVDVLEELAKASHSDCSTRTGRAVRLLNSYWQSCTAARLGLAELYCRA